MDRAKQRISMPQCCRGGGNAMGRKTVSVLAGALASVVLSATLHVATAGEIRLPFGGGSYTVPVMTLKEARFKTVVNQQYDYSCGSAAVATLLTYHYEVPVTETEVFSDMFDAGDQEQIVARGFSLLDMKKYLETKGFTAEGYRVDLDDVAKSKVPAIVVVNINGYRHFVVIKGIRDDQVLVGDPAIGSKIYSRAEFESIRDGDIIFVIITHPELAEKYFSRDEDWQVRTKAPFGSALSPQSLATFTLLLPGRNEF